jgi:ParB family chromosome partitioning protein
MSGKKKGLGKGLDALLGGELGAPIAEEQAEDRSIEAHAQSLKELPVEFLQRGQYQPRKDMNPGALDELAESIRRQGIMQPIMVRTLKGDSYEIIAGERRWRAAQIAQLHEVPVLIRNIPDEATLAVALIENIQRENLNPVEEAAGLKRLMDEFGLTHEEMARSVGRSRTAVTNLLRLLSLSPGAKQLLEQGKIEMGHARAILGLGLEFQDTVAAEVYAKKLSVRQTEALVRDYASPKKSASQVVKSADIRSLEETLAEKLGTKVSVQDNNGKGKLVIEYSSLDTLDGILAHIK